MTDGRVCLITGATSGIGKATAISLAQQGMTLALVSRKREKGELVLREVKEKTGNNKTELFIADLSSFNEVRILGQEVRAKHPTIDILINNAGGVFGARTPTSDGIELTFALNHLTYFLLTILLLDPLKSAPQGRIINVSSQVHQYGAMAFDDLSQEKKYNAMRAYAQSKLANVLLTYELARRLKGTGVTANTLHPGAVRSNFGRELPGIGGFFFRHFGYFMRSPEKAAETVTWLASSNELTGVTGKYFFDKKEIRSSRISYDTGVAQRLWELSEKMTGIAQ
jgi:NAD(P)-dependent dehydrogenase (short-subunit alcohol dehydrogenase family)